MIVRWGWFDYFLALMLVFLVIALPWALMESPSSGRSTLPRHASSGHGGAYGPPKSPPGSGAPFRRQRGLLP